MDRGKDLRAIMRVHGSSSTSAAINAAKEKARLLKEARLQQNLQQQSVKKLNNSNVPIELTERIVPEEEIKKTKVVAIKSLVQSINSDDNKISTVIERSSKNPSTNNNMFDYGDEENLNTTASFTSESALINSVVMAANDDESNAQKGGLGLPVGFFDDVREDIEARGLSVKDEIKRKENEQNEKLESFLGEIDEILGIKENVESDSDDDKDDEEYAEMALQLAYASKAASLMAKIEKGIETIREGKSNESNLDGIVEVSEADAIIAETAGLKRHREDTENDVLKDVMNAIQMKKQKLNESFVKERHDMDVNSNSDDDSDGSYEPLDFTDWQSRTL